MPSIDDGLELDEAAETVDLVQVDADVVEQEQVAPFAHLGTGAESSLQQGAKTFAVGRFDDRVTGGTERCCIGALVVDELGGNCPQSELQAAARAVEEDIALLENTHVADPVEPAQPVEQILPIGHAQLDLDVLRHPVSRVVSDRARASESTLAGEGLTRASDT